MRQEEQLKIQAKAKEYTEWRTEQLPKQMTMSTRNNSIILQRKDGGFIARRMRLF